MHRISLVGKSKIPEGDPPGRSTIRGALDGPDGCPDVGPACPLTVDAGLRTLEDGSRRGGAGTAEVGSPGAASGRPPGVAMRVTLTVTGGPHQGRSFAFGEHDTFIVGRSPEAHFRLPMKDKGPPLALKMITPGVASSDATLARFLREASILRRLDHTNIVGFHEIGYHRGRFYFAMEYVPGPDAFELVKSLGGPLPIARAVDPIPLNQP
jgi:serine/threonine protein kinase